MCFKFSVLSHLALLWRFSTVKILSLNILASALSHYLQCRAVGTSRRTVGTSKRTVLPLSTLGSRGHPSDPGRLRTQCHSGDLTGRSSWLAKHLSPITWRANWMAYDSLCAPLWASGAGTMYKHTWSLLPIRKELHAYPLRWQCIP